MSHRAAIVRQITTQIAAQTGDTELAAQRAQAIVDEKRNRTKAGVSLVAIAIAGAVASKYLGAPWWVTLVIGVGGALAGADKWSNEYVGAALRDFWSAIAGIVGYFRPGGQA